MAPSPESVTTYVFYDFQRCTTSNEKAEMIFTWLGLGAWGRHFRLRAE
jgi:hypothetical protein